MGATDEDIISEPAASYRVCSAITNHAFSGLARCEVTDLYGRYVFIKAQSGARFQLCDVEVHLFRECLQYIVVTITNNKNTPQVLNESYAGS